MLKKIKGFKVLNPDWSSRRGFKLHVGSTYEVDVSPSEFYYRGFDFCREAKDCFKYNGFDPDNRVVEIVALGEVTEDGERFATNKIKIVREISWHEVLS